MAATVALLCCLATGCSSDPVVIGGDGGSGADVPSIPDDGGSLPSDGGTLANDAGPVTIPQVYKVDYLASSGTPAAITTEPSLVNLWGLGIGQMGPAWMASFENGDIQSFAPDGMALGAPVPLAKTSSDPHPMGVAFNGERTFKGDEVIIATQGGVIQGWQPGGGAVIRVDRSAEGARYKALAIARTASGDRLYATNFAAGTVEIFDAVYNYVTSFTDPSLPGGFAPFNVAIIDGRVYVTFAKRNASGSSAEAAKGAGYVDVFDPMGKLERRVLSGGALNAPYGIVHAPRDFGRFGDLLLVANVGDERIHAFDPVRGDMLGQLEAPGFQPIRINGLHDLKFGNDNEGGPHNVLYFTAGPAGGTSGAFGSITPTN